jgi:hypothetical protein
MAIQCESLINFTDDSKFVYGVYELKNAKIIAIFDNEFNKKETTKNEC